MRVWITNRLQDLGKSKAEFARVLGIPFPRASEIIANKRRVQPGEISAFASFLELTVDQALEALETNGLSLSELNSNDNSHDSKSMREKFSQLSEKNKKLAIDFADMLLEKQIKSD